MPAGGQALASPGEIKDGDIQDWSAVLAIAGNRYSNSDDLITSSNDTLVRAIRTIDCGEQVNEPEIQELAQGERRKLCLLLVNRIIGSRTRAVALYERDRYRHTKLAKPIMEQVKALRALGAGPANGTAVTTGYATATIMATRRLNAMMLHWMLGKAVRIPLDVEFATREEEEAAAQAAKEKAEREAREEAERAAAAAAYQRPRWTAEPLTEADTMGKSAEDLRDMVWEIYAAAETRFKRDDLNLRFRGKGYKQTFDEPQLNGVQKENVAKLRQLRSALEGQSTSPNQ